MTPDPTALEAAAVALHLRVRVNQQETWEGSPFKDEVREWAEATVQAYLDVLKNNRAGID